MIPYGHQHINEDDIRAVVEALRSDFLTQGPAVELFEKAIAAYCGVPYAVAVNSGTSALHLACQALDLGPGDTLWTSPNTFVASANCARYCGANVGFVDIDPRTYNMSPDALGRRLEDAARQGRLPKVLVPVHFAGQSCEMEAISALARRYGIAVLEDASHAVGGRYQNRPVGACPYADAAVLSFHPVKIITTGEGGAVLTRRPDVAERVRSLRSHGITRDPARMRESSHGPWYYQQLDLGYNFRMTDIQAALGRSQLCRADAFVERRRTLAARYDHALQALPLVLPWHHPATQSSWHLYVIRLEPARGRRSRRAVFEALRATGIGVNVHYVPVHLQPYYRDLGFGPGDFPEAERYYGEAMTLPLFYAMSEAEQDTVIDELRRALA